MIKSIAKVPDPFALIIKSFCPTIYGCELVKAGLLLTIIGGNSICSGVNDKKSKIIE